MAATRLNNWVQLQTRSKKRKRSLLARRYAGMRSLKPSGPAPAPVVQSHYRRAADSMAEAPDGTVQIWNGVDKPLRFDTAVGSTETVGVLHPLVQVILSGRGNGVLVGTFSAYCRFVDRSGNFSSFSPISNKYIPVTSVGTVTGATFATPIVLAFSAPHNLSGGQIVKVTGILGNDAANGTFTAQPTDATHAALYEGGGVASLGSGTYNSGGSVTTGVAVFCYDNVPVPTESKVVRRQILRNKDGDTSVYFIDIDTTDLTSSHFESQTDDSSLFNSATLFDDSGNTLVDKSLPLTSKKIVAQCLGRMFASGNEPYSEGAVKVTNGSATVTGIGVEWGQLTFPSRFLEVVGGNKTYRIQSVESTSSLTLTENYTGSTDQYAYYTIGNGPGERRTIYWTPPSQPEAWPLTFSLPLAEDPGAGEITGLMPLHSWIYILCEQRIYRFSFVNDPLTDGESVTAAKRGCINNKCWTTIEDMAFCMDYMGFHVFAGNDNIPIGSNEVQDLFRVRPTGPYRINWEAKRSFHSAYDPGEAVMRWFVCLNGAYAPFHAIAYHIRAKRWWLEHYPFPIGSSCLGRMGGRPQVFLGTDSKRIMALHRYSLDAVDPSIGTVQGTVTSSGYDWVIDSAAAYQTGLAGTPYVVTNGKGKGQQRMIVSQSGTRLNMLTPWTDRPDTTSAYQLGGIKWKWRGGWLQFAESPYEMQRDVSVQFTPTKLPAQLFMRYFVDMNNTPKSDWAGAQNFADANGVALLPGDPTTDISIDTTKANGFIRQRTPGMRELQTDAPRFFSLELMGCTNAERFNVLAISFGEAKQ